MKQVLNIENSYSVPKQVAKQESFESESMKIAVIGAGAIGGIVAAYLKKAGEDIVLVGRETILRNGKFAGYLTSGGYGYTIAKPVGYGYVRHAEGVDADYVMAGNYELVVAQEKVKATPHLAPLYDPKNLRIRA